MTIMQLKYFTALAETLNFSHVAEQYYVAQTAISYNIKALERELGKELFIRTTKKTLLTREGLSFYRKAKAAIELIEQAQKELDENSAKSNLTIGCSKLCCGSIFYRVANHFQTQHSDIVLNLIADEPELTLFDKLAKGQIDAAVYLFAPFTRQPDNACTIEYYTNIQRKCLVSRQNPLSQRATGITTGELNELQNILYGDLEQYRWIGSGEDLSRRKKPSIIASDFSSMLDMIGANLGIVALPMLENLSTESVCTIPCLGDNEPEHFLSVSITYMSYNKPPYLQEFIDEFYHELSLSHPRKK